MISPNMEKHKQSNQQESNSLNTARSLLRLLKVTHISRKQKAIAKMIILSLKSLIKMLVLIFVAEVLPIIIMKKHTKYYVKNLVLIIGILYN